MENNTDSILKIYASNTDMLGNRLFYEHIVYLAKEKGIAGVTVYRGIMGYGLSSQVHTSRFWDLTEKLPVVIEMIDKTQKLEDFYQLIETDLSAMPKGCLVTIELVAVRLHKAGQKGREHSNPRVS
jgi:uncharacterized protein